MAMKTANFENCANRILIPNFPLHIVIVFNNAATTASRL